jgi:hypothetical protein
VNTQQIAFQEVMIDRFTSVVEEATGRTVVAFMSANHQHPDLQAEVFVLEGGRAAVLDETPAPASDGDAGA